MPDYSASAHILVFPHPTLRTKCLPVSRFNDPPLEALVRKMASVMKKERHGIGIAAPQIGVSVRVICVDVSSRVQGAGLRVMINPVLVRENTEIASREGCMSIPDYRGDIKRFDRITVRWRDLSGKILVEDFSGIEAVCVQHEIDHLDGLLFIDRVASLKRDLIPRKK